MKIMVEKLSFSFVETKALQTQPSKASSEKKNVVFTDLSFSFSDERPLAVVGASGIGKTTLMRILLGLEKQQKGTITGLENDPVCGVVFQEDRLFEQLSCQDNWRLVQKDLKKEEILSMGKDLGLKEELLKKRPSECSGGERRRVALARALLIHADWYCMDEPFSGLDEESRCLAIEKVKAVTKGKPLFLITHRREDAAELGAAILELKEGQKKSISEE